MKKQDKKFILALVVLNAIVIVLINSNQQYKEKETVYASSVNSEVEQASRRKDDSLIVSNDNYNPFEDKLFRLMKQELYSYDMDKDSELAKEIAYYHEPAFGGLWFTLHETDSTHDEFSGYLFIDDETIVKAGIKRMSKNDRIEVTYFDTVFYEIKNVRKLSDLE